jgi:hypothetical protein
VDTIKYFKWLANTAPRIMMVPLADTAFNRCKSNIAWLEATGAGAAVLAPAWPEWGSCYWYQGPDDFASVLESMLGGTQDATWDASRTKILDTLTLAYVNVTRMNLIGAL